MRKLETLQFDGGCPVFDFTNTISDRNVLTFFDYLESYEHFLVWCDKIELLPKSRIRMIAAYVHGHTRRNAEYLEKIVAAREVLFELFSAIAANRKPESGTVPTFNAMLSEALANIKAEVTGGQIRTVLTADENLPEEPLYVLIKNAYDVLTIEDTTRIKECSNCGWLFLDTTKNGRRRWCNMQVCGSRDKANRYYERKKSA